MNSSQELSKKRTRTHDEDDLEGNLNLSSDQRCLDLSRDERCHDLSWNQNEWFISGKTRKLSHIEIPSSDSPLASPLSSFNLNLNSGSWIINDLTSEEVNGNISFICDGQRSSQFLNQDDVGSIDDKLKTSTTDTHFNKVNPSPATESQVYDDNHSPATESQVFDDNHSPAIESQVFDDNHSPAIESQVFDDNHSPATESQVFDDNHSPATESQVFDDNHSPVIESQVFDDNHSPATESQVYDDNHSPAIESQVFDDNHSPATESQVFDDNHSPATESQVFDDNHSPAVESLLNKVNNSPEVESQIIDNKILQPHLSAGSKLNSVLNGCKFERHICNVKSDDGNSDKIDSDKQIIREQTEDVNKDNVQPEKDKNSESTVQSGYLNDQSYEANTVQSGYLNDQSYEANTVQSGYLNDQSYEANTVQSGYLNDQSYEANTVQSGYLNDQSYEANTVQSGYLNDQSYEANTVQSGYLNNQSYEANTVQSGYLNDQSYEANTVQSGYLNDQSYEANTVQSGYLIDQSYEANTDLTEYTKCKKNPGHETFLGMDDLRVHHLPLEIQHEDSLTFINCASHLVVQISVFHTSPARGSQDIYSRYIGTNRKRNGSGFISSVDNQIFKFRCKQDTCPLNQCGPQARLAQYSRSFSSPEGAEKKDYNKHYYYSGIYVHTNKHVIFDMSEAERAVVKFFFNSPDETKVVYGHVAAIVGVNNSQDHVTVHVMSHDLNLFHTVNCLLKDARSSYRQMVSSTHKSQASHGLKHSHSWVAVIGHAHGMSKSITFGHVRKEEEDGSRIIKYYDAATCPGSSGGLVMTPSLLKLQWPGAVHSASDPDTGLNVTLDSRVHDLNNQEIGRIHEKLTRSNSESSFPSIE